MPRWPLVFALLSGCYPWVGADLHEINTKLCDKEKIWFLDTDGDDWGLAGKTHKSCGPPDGYVGNSGDCNPKDPTTFPGAPDPYGDGVDQDCDACPNGAGDGVDKDCDFYPANDELTDDDIYDCNDNNPTVNPGAPELSNDGVDNDCTGDEAIDADGDGHDAGIDDCDDGDPNTYMGAPELLDCIDNDCDTLVDEDLSTSDIDGDGFCVGFDFGEGLACCDGDLEPGDCNDADPVKTPVDSDGDGYSSCTGDCDDSDAVRYPGNPEVCDGLDNNCDELLPIDEEDVDADLFWPCMGDCDPNNPNANPDAPEVEDGVDNDCDGLVDEGTLNYDDDGDGVSENEGDCDDADPMLNLDDLDADGVTSCEGDCDDQNGARYPENYEICDGLDNDCLGGVPADETDGDYDGAPICAGDCDDGDPLVGPFDNDSDGFTACGFPADCDDTDPNVSPEDLDGDGNSTCGGDCDDGDAGLNVIDVDGDGHTSCGGDCTDFDATMNLDDADGDGFTTCAGDCDDGDASAYPDDVDGDGWGACNGDCNDGDDAIYPTQSDGCDGIDNDCDGETDEDDTTDTDGDGFNLCQGDCDDLDELVNPEAPEICDGKDSDCDGVLPPNEVDGDSDGSPQCEDCDDGDNTRHGQVMEQCNGVDDDCEGVVDDECRVCDWLIPTDLPTIQEALDIAGAGETICVEPGTYFENVLFRGPNMRLVGLYGAEATVIDGQAAGSVITVDSGNERAATVIEGFTITNGAAVDGAGIRVVNDSTPTLRRLIVADNHATGLGGGIFTDSSGLVWGDLFVDQNTAAEGAGVSAVGVDLSDSLFTNNVAEDYGGGISGRQILLRTVRVYGNAAGWDGGGVYGPRRGQFDDDEFTAFDLRVAGNTASRGGGLYMKDQVVDITDAEFHANTATDSGGLYLDESDALLRFVSIANNSGQSVAGMTADDSALIVTNSTIRDNFTEQGIAGLDCDGCALTMDRVVVSDNVGGTGGVRLRFAQDSTLENILIKGNIGTYDAGGLLLSTNPGYTITVANAVISNNVSSRNGGGILIEQDGNVVLDHVVIAGNRADGMGGGLYATNFIVGNLQAAKLVVTGNTAYSGGGLAVQSLTSMPVSIENSIVAGNTAERGGGIFADTYDPVQTLKNVIVANNVANTGGGIYIDDEPLDILYSDFWGNTPDDFDGIADPTGTFGNVSVDPQFANTNPLDTLEWDLHLQVGSPLIDVGDPSILDPDGSQSDLGVYGGPDADLWDLDLDGYYEWWVPGPWSGGGWDCDDLDASVFPGSGC